VLFWIPGHTDTWAPGGKAGSIQLAETALNPVGLETDVKLHPVMWLVAA
jgi:hypothetical protein